MGKKPRSKSPGSKNDSNALLSVRNVGIACAGLALGALLSSSTPTENQALTASVLKTAQTLDSEHNATEFVSTLDFAKGRKPTITRIENTPAKDWSIIAFTKEDWGNVDQFLDRGTLKSEYPLFHLETKGVPPPLLNETAWNPAYFHARKAPDISTPAQFVPDCWNVPEDAKEWCYTSGRVRDPLLERSQWAQFIMPRVDEAGNVVDDSNNDIEDKISVMTYILSSAGAIQHLHSDESHNFLLQTLGRKRFILFPPDVCVENFFLAPQGHHMRSYALVEDAENMPLYRHINEGMVEAVYRTGVTVLLSPGDMLYVPPQWCHYVISDDDSVTLQIWSGSADHQVAGTREMADSIRNYLQASLPPPFNAFKMSVSENAQAMAFLLCYVAGKLHPNGEAASAITEFYDRKFRMIHRTLSSKRENLHSGDWKFEPCCVAPQGIVSEEDMDLYSSRVAGIVRHAFPDLQLELLYRYLEDRLNDAFEDIGTITDFMTNFEMQCGGSQESEQHLVFAVDQ